MKCIFNFFVMPFRSKVFRGICVFAALFSMTAGCNKDEGEADNPYNRPHNPNSAIEVKSISPVSGGIGTKVVVTGSNFGNDPKQVKLFFNWKEALVMNVQDNAIYALVPLQPGEFSDIKVVIGEKESILDGMQFQYFIKTSVTTVSGQYKVNTSLDGPALQATYSRPVMLAVSDDGLIFIADDEGHKIRLLSLKDNVVTTVIDGMNRPWQMEFSPDQNKLYIVEREASNRPILFYVLSRSTGWLQREIYYDQKNESGKYIAGDMAYAGLTCDETYVYMINRDGTRLIRVHQETRKVEVIGENFGLATWNYLAWNKKDRKLYCSAEEQGRLYRFDPYYIPEGKTAPWLTINEVEHIAGTSRGSAVEGNGLNIRMNSLSGIGTDNDGNVYLPDYDNAVIWKIDPELNGTVIAGKNGEKGYRDGDPKESLFERPYDAKVTRDGLIYVADAASYIIRCIAIQ
jgi:DNA-binding beta-propeller fold protein YncE